VVVPENLSQPSPMYVGEDLTYTSEETSFQTLD
jgi:hypothetical protein